MNTIFNSTIILGTVFLITQRYQGKVALTIDQGTLVGKKSLDYWNETFYSFEGIPYAKPPIGELRFKAPEPAEQWSGIYDATRQRPICPQIVLPFSTLTQVEQNEDCLFLNIYSKMNSTELKPVMVYIHGGGLQFGSILDTKSGPELLMTEDIVLVEIAYRLNAFGYLAIDDPKYGIHGNMGFKDQVLALKWIQKNIHYFGGDPNLVTIFGESAGGSSINLLCLSPLAEGLFHRAIMQSGVAGCSWLTTPITFKDLAKPLGCISDEVDKIVNCINKSTTKEIINGQKSLGDVDYFNKILKIPEKNTLNFLTIEKNNSNSFLVENPESIVKHGNVNKVPMIMGFNTDEGFLFAQFFDHIKPNFTDYRIMIPTDIKIDLASNKAVNLGKRIKEFYYGSQTPSNELYETFLAFLADRLFVEKICKFAKLFSVALDTTPVYFYEFNYYTKLNPIQTTRKYINHADELLYLFYMNGATPKYMDKNSEEYVAIHRMIKLWTTFAKTGDPNPVNDPLLNVKWLPIEAKKFNYLKISHKLELKENPFESRMKFWEEIYKEYNN